VYTSKEREFSYKDITVTVKPGVFHPGLFISTKVFLKFIDELIVENKSFLELGAGSGIISTLAAKKGAEVYASDISRTSVGNVKLNAERNNVDVNSIESDLFKNIPNRHFDFIIINPPYYKKDPETEEEYAWFCGSNYEYFINLFNSLQDYIDKNSKVFMILSEVCEVKKIKSIGESKGFIWKIEQCKTVWGEKNFIFSLHK
ncbi:MAG: methyltransferase, partial [Ignavibacteria bacterium]|nr:methyltransferase [Ignavibacteria bacterium]